MEYGGITPLGPVLVVLVDACGGHRSRGDRAAARRSKLVLAGKRWPACPGAGGIDGLVRLTVRRPFLLPMSVVVGATPAKEWVLRQPPQNGCRHEPGLGQGAGHAACSTTWPTKAPPSMSVCAMIIGVTRPHLRYSTPKMTPRIALPMNPPNPWYR